jgi:ribosomal protein S18 acetylase RimI-like enzyme
VSPSIGLITDADIPEVIDLWTRAGVTRPWNDPVKDIAFAQAAPHAVILVGRNDKAIIATAMVGEDGHRGWVYYVAADPDRQGKGLGRAMMAAAENWLKLRGVWKLQLMVRGDNLEAKGFYQALGFREVDTVVFQKVIG